MALLAPQELELVLWDVGIGSFVGPVASLSGPIRDAGHSRRAISYTISWKRFVPHSCDDINCVGMVNTCIFHRALR